jgi:cytochrome P450
MPATPASSQPKGSFLFGNLAEFGKNPLRFLERCARDFGDFVPLRFVHRPVILLNHPDQIESVLATQSRNFHKTAGYRTPFMRRLFGQGLLTSEGALWTQQRRLAQPAFHRQRIAGYADVIVQFAQEMLADWQAGQTRDVHADVMKLTTRVVIKTLFNAGVPPAIHQLGDASTIILKRFAQQWNGWRILLALLPTPGTRRFEQVMREIDEFIFGLIREGRKNGQDHGDLLSMLLLARDEAGQGMNDQQLRDEMVTLMVAGLDTTALAVSWALYLLARHPEAQVRLREEIHQILGKRPPTLADLPQLRFTEAVLKESMRLYPPAWVVSREAIHDCEIGGRRMKKGTSVIMSQWLKHRDPRYFPDAETFRPERWLDDSIANLPKFAYFPFGGGPRVCIGNNFAAMEGTLVLASIFQRFGVHGEASCVVEPWPSITLQPKDGIWLKLDKA